MYLDLPVTLQIQVSVAKPLTSTLLITVRVQSRHVVERNCGRRSRSKDCYDKLETMLWRTSIWQWRCGFFGKGMMMILIYLVSLLFIFI
jgi:hypothetical protein